MLRNEPIPPPRRVIPIYATDLYKLLTDANGNIAKTTSILDDASSENIRTLKEEVAKHKIVNIYQHKIWNAVDKILKSTIFIFISDIKNIKKHEKRTWNTISSFRN